MNTHEEEIKKFLDQLELISEQISEQEIANSIKNFINEKFNQNPPDILLWELMAFSFTEPEEYTGDKSVWGTYFGPVYVSFNKEGKRVEYPSIQGITPEILSYWEKRAKESKNPVLKQRYSNLVWDFSERITGNKPHYSIAQIFIDSVIELAEKDLHRYEIYVIKKLERALSLGLSINDRKRINKLIDTIILYERKIAEDDKPGLWGFPYEYLVKNKKVPLPKEKESEIINDLEKRFARLLDSGDHFAAKKAALLLADYYSRHRDREKVKETLLRLDEAVQKQAEKASPLIAGAWLEEVYHLYLQYGLKNEADSISSKIKKLGEQSISEFKEIKVSIELSKEEHQKYIEWLTDGDFETVLQKVAINFIPKKAEVITQLKDLSKKAPLPFLFSHKIVDADGRLIATVGSLEEDMDGNTVVQMSQNIRIGSLFLREALDALIKKFDLTSEKLVDYLYKSPIFENSRKEFFIRGIQAYLEEDFLVSIHILIPQIEATIRNLAEKIGAPVFKPSRYGGLFYKTLDELLRDPKITDVLGEDLCFYFRVLFTDPRGLNLRNNVCHGISHIETFNQDTADRVLHALLCLALVKEEENTNQ